MAFLLYTRGCVYDTYVTKWINTLSIIKFVFLRLKMSKKHNVNPCALLHNGHNKIRGFMTVCKTCMSYADELVLMFVVL